MVNAQQWLESQEQYNTKEKRNRETQLCINGKNLEGRLDLKDFTNLERLICSDNLLTDIDLTDLNPKKIKVIVLSNNNISKRDLTCFSKFVNLREILINTNEEERIANGIYNRFHGSLEPLRNLTKLSKIIIANTDIDSGLEYLPESVNNIFNNDVSHSSSFPTLHSPSDFGDLGCRKICEQLKKYFSLGVNEIWCRPSDDLYGTPIYSAGGSYSYSYKEDTVLKIWREVWKTDHILAYRKSKKDELLKQNSILQSQTNETISLQNQFLALESRLNQLEKTYEQQLKERKDDLITNINSQIKKKKAEITNILHGGKGSSAQIRKEIKELENQPPLYEKLVKNLQKARNILGSDNNNLKDLTEVPNYLNNSLQELQKEDNNETYEGAYQIIQEIKEKQEKIQVTSKSVEKIVKEKKSELEKLISLSEKITQRLLGNQHLETQIEVSPKK